MTNDEFEQPVNVSTSSQTGKVKTQQSLLNACLGLMIVVIILSFCLFLPAILMCVKPKIAGTITLVFVVIEECAVIAIVVMYCVADSMEDEITQLPHYGFILGDTMLSAATTKSRTHGFALCCAIVAFVTLKLIFCVGECFWLRYLNHRDDKSQPESSTQLSTKPTGYGSNETDD
jgi:hypothetical protein